jgi:energy-converting hydrogenase Eha subunit H
MSMSGIYLSQLEAQKSIEKVRLEQGEEAAKKAECSERGVNLGMLSGATSGALVGSAIFPGVGTVLGALVGGFMGIVKGVEDETVLDNIITGSGVLKPLIPKK